MWRTGILIAVLLGGSAGLASGQDYRDAYPKNPDVDMVGYVFRVTLTDGSDTIRGRATATAEFVVGGSDGLRLDFVGVSDALDGKGMTVTAVESEGTPLRYRHEENQIFIELGRAAEAGESLDVTVHYHGVPAGGLEIGPNKYGDWTWFSDNWSSRVRNWLPVVDHPSDKATTEMIVVAPSRYQVASNGTVAETTDLGDGSRLTHYVNPVPTATWLYFVGVAQFAIQEVDRYEGVPIETWVYWQDRDRGFYDFAEPSKAVLAYYSDLIGPYVNDRLANVVSTATGGGMEAASTPAYSDRSVTGERTRRWQHVVIHEIAHQWFGNAVTEHDWNDVWLSEGFATYYTLLFRNHHFGRDDFVEGLVQARTAVREFYDEHYDFQIVRDYIEDLNAVSGPMMYQKGAWVLHMLREKIGVTAYDAAIRTYYAEFVNRNARTADLRHHMERASGEDLEPFFQQWLFQGGIPDLEGSWTWSDGALHVRLEQVQPTYAFDLEVDVRAVLADGSTDTLTLAVVAGETATATRAFEGEVVDVIIDPDTRLLANWSIERR